MKKTRSPLWISRLGILLLALVGYGLTMARGASFWDCGEFVAASHVLGIPHPPGTPFFVLLGRVADIALGWIHGTAFAVNLLSAVSSALCALLLHEITLLLLGSLDLTSRMKALLAFFAGSISLFGSTFWFNAVEAEVYGLAMATLLLAVWALLRWDVAPAARKDRWLLFFVYVSFLGTGIHTYSMLPFFAGWLFVAYRSGRWLPGRGTLALIGAGIIGLGVLLAFPWYYGLNAVMGALVALGLAALVWSIVRREWHDPLFWATGLFLMSSVFLVRPFLLGWLVVFPVLVLLHVLLRLLKRRRFHALGLSILLLATAAAGYSVQFFMPVRSWTNPVLDENDPQNWESFLSLLERKQYGSMGMLERAFYRRAQLANQLGFYPRIGYLGYHLEQYMASPLGVHVPGSPVEFLDKGEWSILGQSLHRFFWELVLVAVGVAIWLRRRDARWLLMAALFVLSSLGLAFYVNFADGTRPDSSWASSWYERVAELQARAPGPLPALPSLVVLGRSVAEYQRLPAPMRESWLMGPRGESLRTLIAWDRELSKVGLRMPMPPTAVHMEVRERDYFYTPAFLFYAVLMAMALAFAVMRWPRGPVPVVVSVVAMVAWLLPFATHFSTHDRSDDEMARDFALNVLSSVPKGGILFTFGDNDTFPLWYVQMVEKYRTDVVVVNTSLAGMGWYRQQLLRQNPQLQLGGLNPDSISAMAYQEMLAPLAIKGDTSYRLAATPTWRPDESRLFTYSLIAANWPKVPVCFMYSADPSEYGELAAHMPISGLVRQLGMAKNTADSLLVDRVARQYRYTGLEKDFWLNQEATARTVDAYRWLAMTALGTGFAPAGSQNERTLRALSARLYREAK